MPHVATPTEERQEIRRLATPLETENDLEPLLDRLAEARIVLLGEASHGTHDYYAWRAAITSRLIERGGVDFVAVEGDWPDCAEIDRWAKEGGPEPDAAAVLAGFERWPTWMWANREVASFVDWLRAHNDRMEDDVGFFGLDVYSLWESLRRVFEYLEEHEPTAVAAARDAVRCFEPYADDPHGYAWGTRLVPTSCEDEVVELLAEVTRLTAHDGLAAFDARQNAKVVADAEHYYRTMVRADASSWNVRDTHMTDTLDRLLEYHGPDAVGVVWEHNTHVGDARGTDMAAAGLVNVGQLVRERHGTADVAIVGFGGHRGGVIAADAWGSPPRRLPVPPAPVDTHEARLHDALGTRSLLLFDDRRDGPWTGSRHGHRAIGVVYHPHEERRGNWVPTVMGRRYDAFLYFETTEAIEPLPAEADTDELETWPFGR